MSKFAAAALLCTGLASAQEFATLGPYEPVSDVVQHSRVALDVVGIEELLDQGDFMGAKALYGQGLNSDKGEGKRALQAMALKDMSGEALYDEFVAFYGTPSYMDDFQLAAFDGTGPFVNASETSRVMAAKKNLICITTMYTSHEMFEAIAKARDDNRDDATGGPHNWDEGFAFYYGVDGDATMYEMQGKRDADFGTEARNAVVEQFEEGLQAVRADGAVDEADEAYAEIVKQWTISFMQAAIKYSYKLQVAEEPSEMEWAEAYTYWRCIAGHVAASDANVAQRVEDALAVTQSELPVNVHCKVKESLEMVYSKLGLEAKDVKEYIGMDSDPCESAEFDYDDSAAIVTGSVIAAAAVALAAFAA